MTAPSPSAADASAPSAADVSAPDVEARRANRTGMVVLIVAEGISLLGTRMSTLIELSELRRATPGG